LFCEIHSPRKSNDLGYKRPTRFRKARFGRQVVVIDNRNQELRANLLEINICNVHHPRSDGAKPWAATKTENGLRQNADKAAHF
jgi:hypothetical protein